MEVIKLHRVANPLARGTDPRRREAMDRIKAVIRDRLSLPDDVVVSVAELACHDAGCPGVETAIAILAEDASTVSTRVAAAMIQVTDAELERAAVTLRAAAAR